MANFGTVTPTMCGTPAQNYLPWYCIKSEPARELKAQRSLERIGFDVFLPELPQRKPSPFLRPLFPSYLFAKFNPFLHMQAIKTAPGVSYVLGVAGEPTIVEEEVIAAIRDGIEHRAYMEQFRRGDQVVIMDGAFAELRGIFQREISGTERVVILLNALNIHGKIEVDRCDVKPANMIAAGR